MGEPSEARALPSTGSLLSLPDLPIEVLHVKPAADGSGLIVRMLNAGDEEQTATIEPGLFGIVDAWACDLFEQRSEEISVNDGRVSLVLPPRGLAVIALEGSIGDGV